MSLTVLSCEFNSSLKEEEIYEYTGFQYDFQSDDVLLGEGSDLAMLELRPSLVTELSGVDPFVYFSKIASVNTLPLYLQMSNEESMREYAELKFSLLFYDAMLVLFGASSVSLSVGKNEGFAFLLGGIGGFLYLLLLQRSVDELPVPESITRDRRESGPLLRGLKGTIWSVALAIGFALFVARYSSEDLQVSLTPKEVIVGMMGFLACKVSVVLAAYKPMTLHLKSPSDK